VSVIVTDDSGASANTSIYVNVLNVYPVAFLGPDLIANEGETVLLTARATDASPVDILSYNWDLDNDGAFDDAVGHNVSWTWYDDGQFNVGVNVSDDDGGSDCAYLTVTVNNIAPIVIMGISSSIINKKESVTIYGNFSDPGADTHSFLWDFGDGSFSNEPIPNHTYTMDGDYTITFMVMDDDGGMGFDSLNVTVVNTPPNIDKIYASVEAKEEEISSNNKTNVINSNNPEADNPNSSNNHIIAHGSNDIKPSEQETEKSPIIEDSNDPPVIDRINPQSLYTDQRCFLFVKAHDPDENEVLTFSDDSDLVEIDPVFGVITFIPKNDDIGYHFVNITVTDTHGQEDTRLMALKIEDPPTIIRDSRKEESPFPLPLLLIPVIVLFTVVVLMHDFVTKKRAKAKRKKKPKLVPIKVKTILKKTLHPMTIKRPVSLPTYNVMYAAGPYELDPFMNINSELDVVIEYPWEVPL
jgi:PKD repeat protein